MKRFVLLFAVMFVAMLFNWRCGDGTTEPPYFPSKLEEKTFTSPALLGNFFQDPAERKMLVYTPEGYNPDGGMRYPVIYLLHGVPLGDSSFVSPELWAKNMPGTYVDFPQEGFKTWIDNMIKSGEIKPVIIVMADAKTKYGFCFYTNSVLQGNYEDFIAEDLVNYMDANYKTIDSRDGRAVIGHSQGGYGAIRMGLFRSDVFGTVASHVSIPYFEGLKAGIPFLLAENPNGMNGPSPEKFMTTVTYGMAAAWSPNLNNPPFYVDLVFEYPSGAIREDVWQRQLQHDPYTLLDTRAEYLKTLNGFYIDAGSLDPWADLVQVFAQKLTAKGVPHHYEIFNGDHFDKMFERLEVSLKYCSNCLHEH